MKQEIIDHIKNLGYEVYMRDAGDAWLYYTNEKGQIGELTESSLRMGMVICTVHKPCRECGTGFLVVDEMAHDLPSREELEKGFLFAPNWASRSQLDSVRKYDNMQAFVRESEWNGAYHKL